MFETLRKRARKTYLWRVGLSLVGLIIILVATNGAIFQLAAGMGGMDITASPETYEGRAVILDAEFFVTDYVEHTTTTVRDSGSRSTSTDGNSYIAFQSVQNDGEEYSTWYFYSLYMKNSKTDMLYEKINETWEYLNDESGATAPPAPIKVMGTWSRMEPAMERYYTETMNELGIEEGDYDRIYLYTLDTGKLGRVNPYLFWALMAGCVLLIGWFAASVIGCFRKTYEKEIHKYLQKNTAYSIGEIEGDFTTAHPIGKDVWVGKKWTVYMSGASAKIVQNHDLVWGYYFRRTGKNSVSQMQLYTSEKKSIYISLSEELTREALQYYGEEQPQMIIGYDAELERMYQKNFPAFLELKYNPAMKEAPDGTFLKI